MLLGRQRRCKATFPRARSPCRWLGSADFQKQENKEKKNEKKRPIKFETLKSK
jgi:hypothetical protein